MIQSIALILLEIERVIKLKRKIIGIVSFVILEIVLIIMQIYNIVSAFVNGNIAVGIIFSVGFIAWTIWGWALFTDNQGAK